MSDLIRREDAIRAVAEVLSLNRFASFKDIKDFGRFAERMLRNVPSADRPSAVDLSSVYSTAYKSGYEKGKADRPQGKWIDDDFVGQYRCSECDYYAIDEYDYCPNCGCRMKGASNGEDIQSADE